MFFLPLEALIGLEPPSLGATSSQPTGAISLNRCRWIRRIGFFIWRCWRWWNWDVKLKMLGSKWSRDGWDDAQLHLNHLFVSYLGAKFLCQLGHCECRHVPDSRSRTSWPSLLTAMSHAGACFRTRLMAAIFSKNWSKPLCFLREMIGIP